MSRRLVPALALLAASAGASWAQAPAPELHCLMAPVEPAQRARQAALVVEAQVLDAQGFWNAGHTRLFTRHRLRVFSLLKGQVADTTGLMLVTEGGRLGLDQQVLTNTLALAPGQQGVFFLTPAPWPGLPAGAAYTPYASQQGFIEFNTTERIATEPFRTYPALDAAFFKEITSLTGQPRQLLHANPALAPATIPVRRTTAATISSFSPQRLPAGAGAVLTIVGDGFGSSRGTGFVDFRNADDGGSTRVKAREADYLSWTNNRIEVRVPSAASGGSPISGGHPAGSGTVRVTTADQSVVESAGAVTIIYALSNVESTDGTLLQRPNHIALNASGGISFRFGPNFTANAAASAAWQRALATWRCQTGMNWDVAATNATNAIADDGQNVVAFDAGAELPALVLGRTTSYYRGCYAPSGEVVFWVKEIDMQFDDGATFQFGPAFAIGVLGQIDFETVAVHELGHAQQLTHLILPGAVMHYAVARGQNTRALNTNSDVAGGRQVLRVRSFRQLGCGGPALLPAPLTSFAAQYAAGTGTTLTWATRDECFLSSFVVERSLSGDTLAWTRLATVAPRPPDAQYQYVDAQAPGGLHYYRLRLLRPDGSLDNVAPALVTSEGASATASIFPNPVTGDVLRLQYPTAADGTVVFRIYDRLGRRLRTTSVALTTGLNVVPLSLTNLIPGLYILRWQDAQGRTGSRKFVRY
ncbi:T9SS type A sorting domain-containing protein [Hymenobacter sp. M29]|uniref:T9SS type A sorting domain-containing protein n=1 Tax=Hymenobacter mellowenesis TaxID=3063995 RepID=A0ABT9A5E4_9BACT|nr:T9SS type A sorting domain-containing protein [Hymenobacter sp. M29]MDO7845050.1 T9SS type A sorting domain-containing protein [Hymenobacter sp. M29]